MYSNDCPPILKKSSYYLILLSFFFLLQFVCLAQPAGLSSQRGRLLDSLKKVIVFHKANYSKPGLRDSSLILALNRFSGEIYYSNPDSAILLSKQSAETATKLISSLTKKEAAPIYLMLAKALSNCGVAYGIKGDFSSSLSFYEKALKIDKQQNNTKGAAVRFGNIGYIHARQGNYIKALDYYFRALKLDEGLGNKKGIVRHLGNIGIVYLDQNDLPKALDYFLRTLKLFEEQDNKNGIGATLGNIGIVYGNLADKGGLSKAAKDSLTNKSLNYYVRAVEMAKQLGNKSNEATWLGNIGGTYAKKGDYPKALSYTHKALKMTQELKDFKNMALYLVNLGTLKSEMAEHSPAKKLSGKDYKFAENCIIKALNIADSIGAINDKRQMEEALSVFYKKAGNYKLAYEHYQKSMILKDTIFNQEEKQEMVRKEMNFEFDKKEALAIAEHKSELEKQQTISAEKSRKQKIIILAFIIGLLLVAVFSAFMFNRWKVTQKQKKIIELQKHEVDKKNRIIEEKNKDITDSINYAKRIQQAKLPHLEDIFAVFPQSFILFKPKDIVSGDFYFFYSKAKPEGSEIFIAAADCTGHGVPGALMSMIGSEKLNEAVAINSDTSLILKKLNQGIKKSLHQTANNESTRDGMDIALCMIDLPSSENLNNSEMNTSAVNLQYSGANRPLWVISKGQPYIKEYKATKKAMGGHTEDEQDFEKHDIQLVEGDTFYIFTDGYADTFGGNGGKKITTKKLKEILLSIQNETMEEQGNRLDTFLEEWKNGIEQIDDILVIGVRI